MSKVTKRPTVAMPTSDYCSGEERSRCSPAHAQATEDHGAYASATWTPEVRKQEAASFSSLQPRGRGLLQVHGGGLAIANGWSAAQVRGTPFAQGVTMNPNHSLQPTAYGGG